MTSQPTELVTNDTEQRGTNVARGLRVLVCGGRDFRDWELAREYLDRLHAEFGITCVIQGGARGADELADRWAGSWAGVNSEEYRAEWDEYGKGAGHIRNQRMLTEGNPHIVVAFPGGRGTADMVRRARAAGIEVREVI
jgi:predicted Rossmann-fold nucleotide-binding protein